MARLITVEPILVGVMVFIVMYSIISKEYVYHYLSKVHGLANNTKSSDCNATYISPAEEKLQHEVSAKAGEWGLYLNIAGFVPSLIITPLTASWGDVVGRRYPLILSSFGFLVLAIVYILVFNYELPLYLMLFGRLFCGFCGDFPGMLASGFAYLSDISSHSNRTIKIAIGEFSLAFGGIFSSLVSGVWVDAQGYVAPMWFLNATMCASILYVSFILPESIPVENDHIVPKLKSLFSYKPLSRIWNLLGFNKQRTINLLVVMFCFFLQICCFSGMGNVLPIIQMSPPLCFSNTLVGYVAACFTGGFVIGIIFLKVLKDLLSEIWIVFISLSFMIASMLILAFANSFWMYMLGASVLCGQAMATVIFRSFISQLVNCDEQGAVFSLTACAESLSGLVATFIFNGVYVATVSTFPSTVMFVTILLTVIIFSVFRVAYNRLVKAIQENAAKVYSQIDNDFESVPS